MRTRRLPQPRAAKGRCPAEGVQAPAARAGRVPLVLPTRTPVLLEENVVENLPVSVVTVANRHWEIVSRRTTTDSASGGGVTDGIDAGKANGTASEVSREFRSTDATTYHQDMRSSIACRRDQ